MAINRKKKTEIVAGLESSLKDAKSIVFVNFKGLKVNDANKLRKQLTKEKVGYTVAKKTLVNRVLDARGFTGEKPALNGEVAIAYSEDLLAAPREIQAFAKANKGMMSVIGGIFEGAYAGQDKVLTLASIPPMNVLRSQFLNLINSPIQRFVIAASEIAKKKQA
ncbi:MAG: 50S ribosomal protein L10 [Candidatus Paceibacterota bacterium]|jgi:large subunit ribosomal protein L10